jgi:hypothetical protein
MKIQLPKIETLAEDAALYRVLRDPKEPSKIFYYLSQITEEFIDNLERMTDELFGRLVQTYPGEFIEKRQKELSRYPEYRTR